MGRLVLLGKRISSRPGVKHLIAAITRYGDRLGSQFAGAMTYFSFLSLVPILMVGFSVGGIILRNNQSCWPRWRDEVPELLPAGIAEPIVALIDSVVANPLGWASSVCSSPCTPGIGWMGNLRRAIRALWGSKFETGKATADNLVVATVKDLGALAGLAVAVTSRWACPRSAPSSPAPFSDWLGSPTCLAGAGARGGADPDRDGRGRVDLHVGVHDPAAEESALLVQGPDRGSIIAAIGFEILKYALTTILPAFTSTSRTAVIFGPIIGLLFFFNLVAQLVLFVAAWVATTDGDAAADDDDDEEPLSGGAGGVVHRPQGAVQGAVGRPARGRRRAGLGGRAAQGVTLAVGG